MTAILKRKEQTNNKVNHYYSLSNERASSNKYVIVHYLFLNKEKRHKNLSTKVF